MAYAYIFVSFIFFAFLIIPTPLAAGNGDHSYVEDACSVTRYRDLCIHSLASFSSTAKNSPGRWARAGVSVTLGETKNVARYLVTLKKHNRMKGKSGVALSDCIECFNNAIDELHKSLGVLRKLSRTTFVTQMGDLNTWLSAALTDGNTCLDGFEEDQRGKSGNQIKSLQNRVLRATRFTSNALALANKLAATGLGSLPDP